MASLSPAAPDSTPPFFESAKPMIMGHLNDHLIPDLAKIVADYVAIPFKGMAFMAEHWKRYYNVEVEDLKLGPEFYDWWDQPDAIDPAKLNCDTHFSPILCPETVLETAESASALESRTDYSLETLERLVQNPKEGHPSKLIDDSLALNKNIKAGAACYIVVRKGLFARNLPTDKQRKYVEQINTGTHAGYEVLPRALHLATAALVHHTVTGNRHLGDETGMEKRVSYGVCEDTDGDSECPVIVGGFASDGLVIDSFGYPLDKVGVVFLQKFLAHRKSMKA